MFIIKLTSDTASAVIITPMILCFKLLGISLGYVKKAPIAIVKPISKWPRNVKNKTGSTDAIVTFKALVK